MKKVEQQLIEFDIENMFEDEFGKGIERNTKNIKVLILVMPVEMREFYEDGLNILNYFKKIEVNILVNEDGI
jgi:hypothetical protein